MDPLAEGLELRIESIARRLRRLPRWTWWLRPEVFGASKHRYRRGAPLAEGELLVFESRIGRRLPEEYRRFVTRIAASGAGPFLGLLPLQDWRDRILSGLEPPLDHDLAAARCRLVPRTLAEPARTAQECDDWLRSLGGPDALARFDAGRWHPFDGTIPLCHEGCASYSALIVEGTLRGRICRLDLDLQGVQFTPELGFLEWYESWLESVLSGRPWPGTRATR